MLWILLLNLIPLITGNVLPPKHVDWSPTPHGPQTIQEAMIASAALRGNYYGGDMILPEGMNISRGGWKDTKYRWPGYPGSAIVPYVIDRSVAGIKNIINIAMEQYHINTCIRFVPRTNQNDYIRIFSGDGCYSVTGRASGKQDLSLGDGCNYVGQVVHELGHAIGLFHEHQRSDRDDYIWIYIENVKEDHWQSFAEEDWNYVENYTPYNYDSIMHYGNYAFSKVPDMLVTMEAKNRQQLFEPHEKPGLTRLDIAAINRIYKCR